MIVNNQMLKLFRLCLVRGIDGAEGGGSATEEKPPAAEQDSTEDSSFDSLMESMDTTGHLKFGDEEVKPDEPAEKEEDTTEVQDTGIADDLGLDGDSQEGGNDTDGEESEGGAVPPIEHLRKSNADRKARIAELESQLQEQKSVVPESVKVLEREKQELQERLDRMSVENPVSPEEDPVVVSNKAKAEKEIGRIRRIHPSLTDQHVVQLAQMYGELDPNDPTYRQSVQKIDEHLSQIDPNLTYQTIARDLDVVHEDIKEYQTSLASAKENVGSVAQKLATGRFQDNLKEWREIEAGMWDIAADKADKKSFSGVIMRDIVSQSPEMQEVKRKVESHVRSIFEPVVPPERADFASDAAYMKEIQSLESSKQSSLKSMPARYAQGLMAQAGVSALKAIVDRQARRIAELEGDDNPNPEAAKDTGGSTPNGVDLGDMGKMQGDVYIPPAPLV